MGAGTMTRRKRKPYTPPPVTVDLGPEPGAFLVTCPECHAPPGEFCRGREIHTSHLGRELLAKGNWRKGLTLEQRELRGYAVEGRNNQHQLNEYHRRQVVTERQMRAGLILHGLWCKTFLTAEKNGIFVDRTPDPALSAAVQADRRTKYAKISRLVPPRCKLAVNQVARDNLPLSGPRGLVPGGRALVTLALQLREGLDALSDAMGY